MIQTTPIATTRIQTLGHRLSIRAGTSRQTVFMGEGTPTALNFPEFNILSIIPVST